MSKNNKISFFVSSLIGLHTALPYIEEFQKRNINIYLIVPDALYTSLYKTKDFKLIKISDISYKNRFTLMLHALMRILFVNEDYSSIYKYWLSQRLQNKKKWLVQLIRFFQKILPKWASNQVNRNLSCWVGALLANPFPTSKIVAISLPVESFLLCSRGIQVYTIMESWDHPAKAPVGYESQKVFVWNKALKKDWDHYQGDQDIRIAYPVKLDYVISLDKHKTTKVIESDNTGMSKVTYMYPTTFGSSSSLSFFSEEKQLIHKLCHVTQSLGIVLLIKPKPNSRMGELDEFRKYGHVDIGAYQKNEGGGNYTLEQNYNEARLKDLEKANLVINLGTTFAIDAAAFGLPVLQLYIDAPSKFPYLSTIAKYPHLARHLYCYEDCIFKIDDDNDLTKQFKFLSSPADHMAQAKQFSEHLRQWIMPEMTLSEAVENVVDSILE
ncbi:MAG: hypothetical protein F6K00_18360 [Leptolyngbya sp. SIOISBB]|nr:hypothetical protein [Leptolyngbya sp. SIOISBB]